MLGVVDKMLSDLKIKIEGTSGSTPCTISKNEKETISYNQVVTPWTQEDPKHEENEPSREIHGDFFLFFPHGDKNI